jgi:transcriptional regulator with XRE-family HTH domain
MTTIGEKIRRLRKELGLNQAELAEKVGVSTDGQSVVSKWERGLNEPNTERKIKLARLAGKSVEQFLEIEPVTPRNSVSRTMLVVGDIQAGVWRESVEWDHDEQYEVPITLPAGYPDFLIRGYIVRGNSMNKLYPAGTLISIAGTVENRLKPKNGNKVLVHRRNRDGMIEATLKEYVVDEKGGVWLWPRSTDPEHQQPISYKDPGVEEVVVVGIVTGAYIMENIF